MFIIEPQAAYQARISRGNPSVSTTQPAEPQSTQESMDTFWERIIFETLALEQGLPVKIVSLVSSVAKWGDYGRRVDREQRKLDLLRVRMAPRAAKFPPCV